MQPISDEVLDEVPRTVHSNAGSSCVPGKRADPFEVGRPSEEGAFLANSATPDLLAMSRCNTGGV